MRVILEDVPADGLCMFHAIGKPLGLNGTTVKRMLQKFLVTGSDTLINDVPIKQWIDWEFHISAETYAKNFDSSRWWGGALDITILSHLLGVPIYVYDYKSGKMMSDVHPKHKSNLLPFIALCFVNKSHYMHVRFVS
jgi:hypothetical protein